MGLLSIQRGLVRNVTRKNAHVDALGEFLVARGLLSLDRLEDLRRRCQQRVQNLQLVAVDEEIIADAALLAALGEFYGVPTLDLNLYDLCPTVVACLPGHFAIRNLVIPVIIHQQINVLVVAMVDPADLGTIDTVRFVTAMLVEVVVVTEAALAEKLKTHFGCGN